MTTIQIMSQVSTEQLLRGVASLPADEFEEFVDKVLALRAKLKVPSIPNQEAQLLHQINQGLSAQDQARFSNLEQKRKDETLTDVEHQELLKLIEQIEQFTVSRMQALTKLAALRQVSVPDLMRDLGIKTPDYA
ncbi:MAG: hypothetical protein E6Q83_14215 [Thiothrix sp.]|nr:MAG: hypothetical protein E6Q83_14215 [Thiothrix sp.]